VTGDRRAGPHELAARGLRLAYDGAPVVHDLDLAVPDGAVTAIVGANACGKSTLLRGLARIMRPRSGAVTLDGADIHRLPTKEVARTVGLLPQSPTAPDGIRVADLVARGRHPHQGVLRRWSREDDEVVAAALTATGTQELADRPVDALSGGQRQRVWIAMALAQDPDILLLDEPTSFLDVAHQVDVLDLLAELNHLRGTTVVMVLHDLNLAARYADHMIAMAAGRIVTRGTPAEVMTPETIRGAFGLEARVVADPVCGTPMMVPVGRFPRGGVGGRGSTSPVEAS
jgi:iron complex transport system ATP-binding protein